MQKKIFSIFATVINRKKEGREGEEEEVAAIYFPALYRGNIQFKRKISAQTFRIKNKYVIEIYIYK